MTSEFGSPLLVTGNGEFSRFWKSLRLFDQFLTVYTCVETIDFASIRSFLVGLYSLEGNLPPRVYKTFGLRAGVYKSDSKRHDGHGVSLRCDAAPAQGGRHFWGPAPAGRRDRLSMRARDHFGETGKRGLGAAPVPAVRAAGGGARRGRNGAARRGAVGGRGPEGGAGWGRARARREWRGRAVQARKAGRHVPRVRRKAG